MAPAPAPEMGLVRGLVTDPEMALAMDREMGREMGRAETDLVVMATVAKMATRSVRFPAVDRHRLSERWQGPSHSGTHR